MLTMTTSTSGSRKNSANTSSIGPACSQAIERTAILRRPLAVGARVRAQAAGRRRQGVRCIVDRHGHGKDLSSGANGLSGWDEGCRAHDVTGRAAMAITSGGDELVPLADHVVVLVHDGVPAHDAAHAVVVGAAVAHRAGLFHQG